MNDEAALREVPPWFQYLLVHGLKRALKSMVKVIEDMQLANGWTPPADRRD